MHTLVGIPVELPLATEYPAVRTRRPDMVARLADSRIYHLELQAGPDRRMLEYYLLLAEHHDTVVRQQVLLVGARGGMMDGGIDHLDLQFHYSVIDIRSIDPAPLLASPAIEDNVLAFLCRYDDLQEHVRTVLARRSAVTRYPSARTPQRGWCCSALCATPNNWWWRR